MMIMINNRKTAAIFSLFFFSFFLSVLVTAESEPATWYGGVNLTDGTTVNQTPVGAVVRVYVNNVFQDSVMFGKHDPKYYIVTVNGNTGDNISFTVNGVSMLNSDQTWTIGDHELNFSMTTISTGNVCLNAGACTSGYCADGYCCDTTCETSGYACNMDGHEGTCYPTNGSTASGVDTTGGGGAGGEEEEEVAEEEEEAEELQPVVVTEKISASIEIKDNKNLQDTVKTLLGITELEEEFIEEMITNSQKISQQVNVNREVSAASGKTTVVTKLTYAGTKKAKNFIIHDVVPKTFASSAHQVTVTAPEVKSWRVVNPDPEFAFLYSELKPGQNIQITYSVSEELNESVVKDMKMNLFAEEIEEPLVSPDKICTPDHKRCSGPLLQQCNTEGNAWETLETCEYGCDPANLECKEYTPDSTPIVIALVIILVVIIALVILKKKL